MKDIGLKRVLGLPAVTFIAIGMTIGGGVFIFTGIVFRIAGRALPIAYALAVIPVFISMMPLAMLGSAIPTTGGNYRYPSRMVSPGLAFVGIWIYALASFFGQIPLYALACGNYVNAVFSGISPVIFAIVLVTLFLIINLLGIKLAAQIQGILVLTLISALLYYSFSGFGVINPGHFANIMEKGGSSLVLGISLLTFTYFGANGIIELGGEIINPGITIPRAFFMAFPIIAILYIGISVATVGAVPFADLQKFEEPLISVGRITLSPGGLVFFIIGGAVLALSTTLNALFIFGTKSLLMIIQDDILPSKLGNINRRFGTPHILLLAIWIFSILGILSGFSLKTLASYAALGGLIIFFPIMLASVKFPKLYPDQYRQSPFKLRGFWLWFCPAVGIMMVIFFSVIILADLKTPLNISLFLAFIVSGILYYLARSRWLRRRGTDLTALKKNDGSWDG